MKDNPTISADMIRLLLKYASGSGMDDREILSSAGLDPHVLDNARARIPAQVFDRLWDEVSIRSGDDNFGLHFAQAYHPISSGHILFAVMLNCGTVRSAIEKFCKYHNLMNDAVRPRLEIKEDAAMFGLDVSNPSARLQRHAAEALLGILNSIFVHLTEGACTPLEVRFQHKRPDDITEHKKVFGAPLLFLQEKNSLILERRHLDRKVFLADRQLLETLEHYALNLLHRIYLPDTFSDRVVKVLVKDLHETGPSLESVAKKMALSVRTLQVRLTEEGTTFTKLLDHVRHELALRYLKDPGISICDVAFLLGFSEQSAFNHAFRRWRGTTPGKYRGK